MVTVRGRKGENDQIRIKTRLLLPPETGKAINLADLSIQQNLQGWQRHFLQRPFLMQFCLVLESLKRRPFMRRESKEKQCQCRNRAGLIMTRVSSSLVLLCFRLSLLLSVQWLIWRGCSSSLLSEASNPTVHGYSNRTRSWFPPPFGSSHRRS